MWSAAANRNVDEAAVERLRMLASGDVADRVLASFPGTVERTVTSFPVVEVQDDRSVVINDCFIVTPPVTSSATLWYSGRVALFGGAWVVSELIPESLIGCVPAELGIPAIQGYENYWDARLEFWDPADPQSPLVAETTTGDQRALIRGLLEDHQARRLVLRGRPETHPEIIEVRSPTELVILDCQLQDPERGLFVAATGERLPNIAPIREDQRDIVSAVMQLEDGRWRVADVQGQVDAACEYAPTERGLPQV